MGSSIIPGVGELGAYEPERDDPPRGERVAGDYHPHRPDLGDVELRRLRAATVVLRESASARDGEDGFGLIAAARLLEQIADVRDRGDHVDVRILAAATDIAVQVNELGPVVPRPGTTR